MAYQIKWTGADAAPDVTTAHRDQGAIARHSMLSSDAAGFAPVPREAWLRPASALVHKIAAPDDLGADGIAAPAAHPALADSLASGFPSPQTGNLAPVIGATSTTAPIASVVRLSVNASGVQGNADSYFDDLSIGALSPDGTKLVFESNASNLVSGSPTGTTDTYIKDLTTGAVTLLAANVGDGYPVFSPDGTKVAFSSQSSSIVSGDTNSAADIFVKDLSSGVVTRVTTDSAGVEANNFSGSFQFSADSTKIVFSSFASNLVSGDINNQADIFVKNLASGAVTLVSTTTAGGQGNFGATQPSFSPDGTKVVFQSSANNLVAGDTNGKSDVFVKDLVTGVLTRVSVDAAGAQLSALSAVHGDHAFSPDGNKVLFQTHATTLPGGNPSGFDQVYIKDLVTGAVTLVSSDASGTVGNADSFQAEFSSDGSKAIFSSTSTNLVAGDTNGVEDIFIKDLNTGAVTRVTPAGIQGDGNTGAQQISADGSKILFGSLATNLVSGDTNNAGDVFVANLGYVGHAAPVAIAAGLTLSDADSATLAGASVAISNGFQSGDTLSVDTTGTGITAAFNAATHVLTLTGSDSVAHYQSVLRAVAFSNTSNNDPGAAPTRTFTWTADDGAASNHVSNSATTTINVFDGASPANSPPTGSVLVTGTATMGQVLTADASGLADPDGLGTFHYEWQHNSGGTWSDVGTDQATYVPKFPDVNDTLRVIVHYTDGNHTAESVTSAPTAAVTYADADPTGVITIAGTPTENQTLSVDFSGFSDADGIGAIQYSWFGGTFGVTTPTYHLTNADVGDRISVEITYTDGLGVQDTVMSVQTTPVVNVNDPPVGTATISGTPVEDGSLFASPSFTDADGIGTLHYQWQRDSGSGYTNVFVDSFSYQMGDADVGTHLRVVISYTDNHGTAESVTSDPVGPVANINDPHTGNVTVYGTPTDHQTLTAYTATLADADGLGPLHYQWQRDGGSGYVNVGTDQATYTLGDSDSGGHMRVVVSYTDHWGTFESSTSDATATVTATDHLPAGTLTIDGSLVQNQVLTANVSGLSDADGFGNFFTYQWQVDSGHGFVNVGFGTNQATYTLSNADVGGQVRLVLGYTDQGGTAEQIVSAPTAAVLNANDPPTGFVSIFGNAIEGNFLQAQTGSIGDPDGLGTFHYQWQRNAGTGFVNVGTDNAVYLTTNADVGAVIRTVVSYVDGHGTPETVTSNPTATIANVNDNPTGTVDLASDSSFVLSVSSPTLADADGLGAVHYDWLRGSASGGGPVPVATDQSTYVLSAADAGSNVFALARYTDGHGTAEAPASAMAHIGTSGNDVIIGSSALNEIFVGGGGNDNLMYNGAGTASAMFSGNHSDYAVTFDSGIYHIADQRAGTPDGTDSAAGIRTFVFADGTYNYDASGNLLNHTSAVTVSDTANTALWSSVVTALDTQGSIAAQTVHNDNGTTWVNSFDSTGAASWAWKTDSYNAAGQLVSESGANDDGTHWLTLRDVANVYAWTTATVTFDAAGNQTSVTGTNDDGSHTVTARSIAAAYDTALWFTSPYDADQGGAPENLTLTGGSNLDQLYGHAGNDTLNGAGGNDVLSGGTGNDLLTGGAGDDHFVFHNGDGLDVITDFTAGDTSGDVVELHAYGIANFAALQPFMSQSGSDVVIAFDPDNTITLQHVTLATLNAGDFMFS